jgi:hypothetical protein
MVTKKEAQTVSIWSSAVVFLIAMGVFEFLPDYSMTMKALAIAVGTGIFAYMGMIR